MTFLVRKTCVSIISPYYFTNHRLRSKSNPVPNIVVTFGSKDKNDCMFTKYVSSGLYRFFHLRIFQVHVSNFDFKFLLRITGVK